MRVGTGSVLSGRYRLDQRLGRGGAGAVYRARDLALDQDVAIKVLRTGEDALLPDGTIDLRREARAAMQLSHPGVARVHTYDCDGDVAYLVMEFIDGATLTRCRRARPDGRLPLDVAGPIMLDVLDALACAHDAGLVHNDINPANIMLTRSGQVKLLDFGLAGAAVGPSSLDDPLVGTPAYLSPERIAGAPSDGRSDLYALAAVFFAMVDGQPPFGRDPDLAVSGHTSQPLRRSAYLPDPVADVVRRAMAKQPTDRFSTARELASALRSALEQAALPAASVLRATRSPTESVVPTTEPCTDVVLVDELSEPLDSEVLAGVVLDGEDAPMVRPPPTPRAPVTPAPVPPPPGMVRVGGHDVEEGGATTYVAPFWLDRLPVTNADYGRFVAATRELPPAWWARNTPPADRLDHPVVGVSLAQARRYAEWAGKRLPFTMEWVAAARGAEKRLLPWGDACEQKACHCPLAKPRHTAPVDAHPDSATPEGVLDLIGNVWEWTARDPALEPPGDGYHFVMGGSFKHTCSLPTKLPRNTVHASGEYLYLGFRCAASVGGQDA